MASRKETYATQTNLPGQVVLVMQGGGALGAFQAGVYEALHEAGIEPDWVVGTSIGAINGALIAGNAPERRLQRLREFWTLVGGGDAATKGWNHFGMAGEPSAFTAFMHGVPGFFTPNPRAWFGIHTPLGIADAGFYDAAPLRRTLGELVDFRLIGRDGRRLTLGAVNVRSGQPRYFDSRNEAIAVDHVLASGALPPAFPAVMIDGEPYWDGGIYSNTPIEVVLDDNPRHDSIVFATELWQREDEVPQSIQQVMGRHKDIQYASRADSHIARHQQLHHLRHVVRALGSLMPEKVRASNEAKELLGWGCGTVMHVLPLRMPAAVEGADHTKDIDFTPGGIATRWEAGLQFGRKKIVVAPWERKADPMFGIVIHE